MATPVQGHDPVAPHTLSPQELKDLLEAEQAGQPFLVYRNQDGRLSMFTLGSEHVTRTVGRRAETDLPIPWDSEVSALHAELQWLGGEWMIVDDGLSTNGTFVNGERVHGRHRLHDGDRVRVGQTVIAFNGAEASVIGTTVTAGDRPALPRLTDSQRCVLIALCRPYRDSNSFATPATNQQIAEELYLSVDAIKMHLRTLFSRVGLSDLPQNQKRARLAEYALQSGLVVPHDLD
jgi:pSer/pThr/pTyr-binding forkhead associated (FHA) protein